eukprot:3029632-Rhodomonas_salina.1
MKTHLEVDVPVALVHIFRSNQIDVAGRIKQGTVNYQRLDRASFRKQWKIQVAGQIVALIACQPFHLHQFNLSQITSVTRVATECVRASRVDEVRVSSRA